MKTRATACIALSVCCAPALAIYKCKDANGTTIFSDEPCGPGAKQIDVRPAAPSATPPASTPTPSGAKPSEREKLMREADEAAKARRVREIAFEIDAAEKRITSNQDVMERKIAELRVSKRSANNNLAGATWESSLSQEMDAVSRQYGALIADDREKIKSLQRDREALNRVGKP